MSEPFILTERPSVYLASRSPRRHELLRQLGIEFTELQLREAAGRDYRFQSLVLGIVHSTPFTMRQSSVRLQAD